MNKKGTSLSIVLLVLLVLLLVGTSLFMFATENNRASKKLSSPFSLSEGISNKQAFLDFYLQDIVERSAKGVNNEQEFVDNIKLLSMVYGGNIPKFEDEFDQIADKAVPENIQIVDNTATFNLEIIVQYSLEEKGVEKLFIEEPYSRTFTSET